MLPFSKASSPSRNTFLTLTVSSLISSGSDHVCSFNSPLIALGVIETFTGASAIVAADHAAKTAQVDVFEIRVARGMCGKSYVLLTGSVAAVEAAVEETVELLKDEGTMLDYAVIPSPSKEFVKTLM